MNDHNRRRPLSIVVAQRVPVDSMSVVSKSLTRKKDATMTTNTETRDAASESYKIAMAILAANPRGTDGHSAAWAALCAASTVLETARKALDAEYAALAAAKAKPSPKARKASGGRVVHSVGRKAWTEY